MAYPTITFNNASGSDTAASGAGPATALSGTSASFSGNVVTLDGSPDLSSVATDGSHVLWLQTTTGRQFFTISATNDGADQVTLDDAPAGTSTGLTWGLGGARKTLDNSDSRLLLSADFKSGWVAALADDQTVSSTALSTPTTENVKIVTDTSGTLRTITQTANAAVMTGAQGGAFSVTIKGIKLANSNGTKTNAYGFDTTNNTHFIAIDSVIGDATNQLLSATDSGCTQTYDNTEVSHCTSDGIQCVSRDLAVHASWIHDNGAKGLDLNNTNAAICNSIIADNTEDGIYGRSTDLIMCCGNVIDDNGGDGIDLSLVNWHLQGVLCGNTITNNGGYGIRGGGSDQNDTELIRRNNFGTGSSANTSGDVLTAAKGDGNVNVDPQYTDAANDNYTSGANLKEGANIEPVGVNSATNAYVDIGVQQQATGGGGSTLILVED